MVQKRHSEVLIGESIDKYCPPRSGGGIQEDCFNGPSRSIDWRKRSKGLSGESNQKHCPEDAFGVSSGVGTQKYCPWPLRGRGCQASCIQSHGVIEEATSTGVIRQAALRRRLETAFRRYASVGRDEGRSKPCRMYLLGKLTTNSKG